ncbi:hypothetical protein [Kribbella sp. NPDC000426]|uniref:hypothetical protein n=1 Tax=Kribbella sp. NPDC000426 TaxID=3154255 RepID=UPI00333002E0
MMRATYEDLLRTARRIAANAQRGVYPDKSEVLADWQAVLFATKNHLRWLRLHLKVKPGEAKRSDNALGRLAQAIGAGADLLAVQDAGAAAVLDVGEDLVAARSEVAAIALMAGEVAMRSTRARDPERSRVRSAMRELAEIASADVRRTGLGGLALLAAGRPAALTGDLSLIGPAAARWERAHAATSPEMVLTRDLRSATAQLRTIGGDVWHIATQLLSAQSAGLDATQRRDLDLMRSELHSAEASSRRVESSWRRRLSDLGGLSESPAEIAFLDLKSAVSHVLGDDRGLRRPRDLIPDHRTAMELVDTVDEVLWCTEQVWRHQQRTVRWLVGAGRLFVPRQEASQVDIYFLRRPGGGSRPLQARWVRTGLGGCFDDLTSALAESAEHGKAAGEIARRLAATSAISRRTGEPRPRTPGPYVAYASGIDDQGQELAELCR